MKNFEAKGERITYTVAGTAISSGDARVVGDGLLAIAVTDGALGDNIEMATEGVFRIPKVAAAVITRGENVLWDSSEDAVEDNAAVAASGDFICGTAWETRGAATTDIAVKINTSPPAVTA